MSQVMNGRLDAIIFDLDDTLITWEEAPEDWREATRPHMERAYSHLLARGHALPDLETFIDAIRQRIRQTWEEARQTLVAPAMGQMFAAGLADLGLQLTGDEVDDLLRAYGWGPMTGVVPYPDTYEVLSALQAAGYKLGLVTNSAMPMWMRDAELVAYDLLDYFDARITSGDTRYIKPHPAIYERILKLLDTPPARAMFVGDNPQHDIAGANQAGLISVLIDPPHLNRERDGVQPDFVITQLRELLPIVSQIEGRQLAPAHVAK